MQFRNLAYAASLASLVLSSACGDDDPLPMECGGHGQPVCTDDTKQYLNREGGEIRLEYRFLPNGTNAALTQAFFLTAQTPEKLMGANFNSCSNVLSYESAAQPKPETIASRQFRDVGDKVTLTGAGKTIELSKHLDTPDFRNQVEGILYVKDAKPQGTVDVTSVVPGETYQATFANGNAPAEGLKVPRTWTTTNGPMFDGTVHTITKNQALNWTFNSPDTKDDAGIAFLNFPAKDGTSRWFCPFENTGSITVPAEIVDSLGVEGTILAGTIRHLRVNFEERNLDLITVNCRIQPYKVE